MDKSNLIDFNDENCYKLASPLIPAPVILSPRLSEGPNNPFDEILRTISNQNDPFECNTNVSIITKNLIENEKENIHLISPIRTPIRPKKHKKLALSPLRISSNDENIKDVSSNLSHSGIRSSNSNFNIPNISLQILSESALDHLSGSFNIAFNMPLPSSPNNTDNSDNAGMNLDSSNVITKNESKPLSDIGNNTSNQVDNLNIDSAECGVSALSSADSKENFPPKCLSFSNISSVLPSVSSMASRGSTSNDQLNQAFINFSGSSFRQSFSAENIPKTDHLNRSFAGFNYKERQFQMGANSYSNNSEVNDSVFFEATQLAQIFRSSAASMEINSEDIIHCTAPWEDDEVIFVDLDDDEMMKQNNETKSVETCLNNDENDLKIPTQSDIKNNSAKVLNLEELTNGNNSISDDNTHETEMDNINNQAGLADNSEVENAKALLHNLTAILNKSGNAVDRKTLGENLLSSLALALNIENNNEDESSKCGNKLQRSKSDSKVSEKRRFSSVKDVKIPSKLKSNPVSIKLEKNLKVKNEKEKCANKGPLKALIPLTNMAKTKNSSAPKTNLSNITPPRQTHSTSQNKRTSTPNESKMKPPIAQSTPEGSKLHGADPNSTTPSRRQFGFSLSPLLKSNSNDTSYTCFNNSLSPKTMSGSNINKSSSNSTTNSNTSIPTMKSLSRRNSASDISTTKSSNLNKSCDNKQPARLATELKRSSSFQNKSAASSTITNSNNNTVKKYGRSGLLKTLKLIPKMKKATEK